MSIILQNQNPTNGALGISISASIQVDIVRSSPLLDLLALEIYVEGTKVFKGSDYPLPFRFPFFGPGSSVAPIADGYRIILDRTEDSHAEFINVQVRELGGTYGSVPVGGWSFRAGNEDINDLYLASCEQLNPEPGIRRIHVRQLVGEWKPYETTLLDGYAMPVVLSTAVTIGWPSDIVHTLSSKMIDGYLYLVSSTDQGTIVTKNETADIRIHADGYDSYGGHMTTEGTLYLINKDLNRLEVYYGADYRAANRLPDFWYDVSSTPPLLAGDLLALHVAEGESTIFSGGSRLYVGCSSGFTKIETYDKGTDGYADGYDNFGLSYTYGIPGSLTDFPILGGTISNVVAINSDETNGVIFAATNNGIETGGGLSQISISQNTLIFFMTKEGGYLPSNVIRDIAIT